MPNGNSKLIAFESFVEGVIYDRDLSVSARIFGLFLKPFSLIINNENDIKNTITNDTNTNIFLNLYFLFLKGFSIK